MELKHEDFEIISQSIIKVNSKTFYVKSRTNNKTWYMIYKSNKKGLICNCRNFSMFRGKKQVCWHIEEIKKII